jgi:serine/threonine protein kinase
MSTQAATRRNEILERALSLDRTELAGFLEQACAGNAPLRRELERLLRVHAYMGTWSLTPADAGRTPQFEPGQWLGRYELRGVLGCGGMGIVYRAYDPVIGRPVAVKVLAGESNRSQDHSSRFLSELRILGSIVHDNVVRVYDYGEVEDFRYIVMELLEGEDLARAIAGGRCGGLDRKLEITRQVAAALEHIHEAGIVHRDLKPGNVFLESSGRVKLMDFGIAQSDDFVKTQSGEVIGTPQYMAPERLKGLPGGPSMDVYAFGIVLFELLTGQKPYFGNSSEELLADLVSHAIPIDTLAAAGVPHRLIDLIERATNSDPAGRPQDFSEILQILDDDVGPADGEPSRPAWRSRRGGLLIAASCASIALLSLAESRPERQNDRVAEQAVVDPVASVLPASVFPVAAGLEATATGHMPLASLSLGPSTRQVEHTPAAPLEASTTALKTAGNRTLPSAPLSYPAASAEGPVEDPAAGAFRIVEKIEREPLDDSRNPSELDRIERNDADGTVAAQAREMAAVEWARIQTSEDPDVLRAFHVQYPESEFSQPAIRLAQELEARQAARREILSLLERYALAHRDKNVREIAATWPGLGAERLRMIEASFAHAEKLEFELAADREPELGEPATRSAFASPSYQGNAVVAGRRRVRMTDRSGVRPEPADSRVLIRLTRADNRWRIISID